MNFTDCGFPTIEYSADKSPFEWGFAHGQEFKKAIIELFTIRKGLMLDKNPALEPHLDRLAKEQLDVSKDFSFELSEELRGIAEGSGLSITDIVILNNYTDFRDIQLPDQGCSTIHVQNENTSLSGQTWDMHGSAKNYLCVIKVPKTSTTPEQVILSLVGCVGLMGMNDSRCLIGVNNINTENARAALIWPVLVRKALEKRNRADIIKVIKKAPVTSGHNYIISDKDGGEHWEVTPTAQACPTKATSTSPGVAFHTNHCLADEIVAIETPASLNSTTHNRYAILERKAPLVNSFDSLKALLTDHEEFPKSICSHFETSAQDPSFTCGGGIMDMNTGDLLIWRGCKKYDDNYKEFSYKF